MTSPARRPGRLNSLRRPALVAGVALALLAPASAALAGSTTHDHGHGDDKGRASASAPFAAPKIKHVWTIIMENKSFESSFTGLNQNSYLWKTLPSYGVLLRQYYGTSHYSQGNYLSMMSGQGTSPGPQSDCPKFNDAGPGTAVEDGQHVISNGGCVFPSQVKSLPDQLDAAKVSWKGYMQDMGADPAREQQTCGAPINTNPTSATFGTSTPAADFPNPGGAEGPYAGGLAAPTSTPDDQYVAKHNPFPWFSSLVDSGSCAQHVVPLVNNLLSDLTSEKTTPAWSFITPNNCSDAHDATCKGDNLSGGSNALTGEKKTPTTVQGGLYAGDLFLEQVIPAIMASPAYQDGGLIDVTFDEGFPPYTAYGNSIADYGANGTGNANKALNTPTDTAQSVVACCNELPGPNTRQPGFQAFGQDTTPGGGITGSVLISPYITPGSVSDQPYNHYSYLRSMEDLLGIHKGGADGRGHLGFAAMDGLRPFGPDVYNNPSARPLAPATPGTGGVYTAVQTLTRTEKPISHLPIDDADAANPAPVTRD